MTPPEPAEIVVAEEPPMVKFPLPPVVEAATEVGMMMPPSPTIIVVEPSMMMLVVLPSMMLVASTLVLNR
jgi:hypothetical protein